MKYSQAVFNLLILCPVQVNLLYVCLFSKECLKTNLNFREKTLILNCIALMSTVW